MDRIEDSFPERRQHTPPTNSNATGNNPPTTLTLPIAAFTFPFETTVDSASAWLIHRFFSSNFSFENLLIPEIPWLPLLTDLSPNLESSRRDQATSLEPIASNETPPIAECSEVNDITLESKFLDILSTFSIAVRFFIKESSSRDATNFYKLEFSESELSKLRESPHRNADYQKLSTRQRIVEQLTNSIDKPTYIYQWKSEYWSAERRALLDSYNNNKTAIPKLGIMLSSGDFLGHIKEAIRLSLGNCSTTAIVCKSLLDAYLSKWSERCLGCGVSFNTSVITNVHVSSSSDWGHWAVKLTWNLPGEKRDYIIDPWCEDEKKAWPYEKGIDYFCNEKLTERECDFLNDKKKNEALDNPAFKSEVLTVFEDANVTQYLDELMQMRVPSKILFKDSA